jgi:hypothetical protein
MKYSVLPIVLILFISCCSKKVSTTEPMNYTIESNCPEDGTCTITIYPNEKLEILTDETGAIYYKKIADINSTVFHFQYNRTVEEGIQDGQYQEEVIFEYSNENLPLNLTDLSLEKTKMLFGRHCFCKGQAGYFRVNFGNLNLSQTKGKTTMNLQFKVPEVPQIITEIQGNWK